MNETFYLEMWQIEVGGQIYEANFEEMTQWISEGSLLPQDKVRRGNLRWIEAQRIPELLTFFNAKAKGEPFPVMTSTIGAAVPETHLPEQTVTKQAQEPIKADTPNQYQEFSNFAKSLEQVNISKSYALPNVEKQQSSPTEMPPIAEFCGLHSDAPTAYYCETCCNAICKICPKSYGGNVRICPFCGAMCKSIGKIREEFQQNTQNKNDYGASFGFTDFGRALAKPFKHKFSFIVGAAMFMFFSLGQSAAGIGGMFFVVAALMSFMMANMLTFGILANTISNFSQGKLDKDFMAQFEDFSIWDDVVHPFFLSIGAYLSSFGPFILVCIAGVYLVYSSVAMQNDAFKAQVEKIPGTDYYDTSKTVKQSDEVKKLLEGVRDQNAERLNQQQQLMQGGEPVINPNEDVMEQMQKNAEESRRKQVEAVTGTSPEAEKLQNDQFNRAVAKLPSVLIIAGFLSLLWGIFYFPAACAVAGYTSSFGASLNISVGLDTIKRLGLDYVKILAMFIVITICMGIISAFLSSILAPFDLPKLGNIPAKVVISFFTFYFSIVFSCILGYAIFKNADKLKIYRG
jgi:hypothetical protein